MGKDKKSFLLLRMDKAAKIPLLLTTAASLTAAFAEDVAWPSDFNEKLAAHIASEMSTNTTSEAGSGSIDVCFRTVGISPVCAVARTPGSGFYYILR